MKALDPTKMKDWEVAEAAEAGMKPAAELIRELGIEDGEWDAYGRYLAKIDVAKVLARVGERKRAKYIDAMSGSSQMEAIPVIMDLINTAAESRHKKSK